MRKIWVNKVNSFEEAEKVDEDYYLKMTPSERLDIMQFLREVYFKLKKDVENESREGLRRCVEIIKQT